MSDTTEKSTVVNLEEVESKGRPYLKPGSYGIRCIACEQKASKRGNQMLEFKYELVTPETIGDAEGKDVKIGGLQLMDWIVLNDTGLPRLKALHKTLKLGMQVDLSKMNTRQYLGQAVNVSLATEVGVVKDENTGEPIMDDKGAPVTSNNYRIKRYNSQNTELTIPADSVAY